MLNKKKIFLETMRSQKYLIILDLFLIRDWFDELKIYFKYFKKNKI